MVRIHSSLISLMISILFSTRDKLANYLMLKLYDNDDRERASSVPNWKNVKTLLK